MRAAGFSAILALLTGIALFRSLVSSPTSSYCSAAWLVMLEDGTLSAWSSSGDQTATGRLPVTPARVGRQILARCESNTEILAVHHSLIGRSDSVEVFSLPSLDHRRSIQFPIPTPFRIRGIVAKEGAWLALISNERGASVLRVDGETYSDEVTFAVAASDPLNSLADAAVSPDGRTIAFSYHGGDIDGIDYAVKQGSSWQTCRPPEVRALPCLPGHGSLVLANDELFVNSGRGEALRYQLRGNSFYPDGVVNPGIPGNHLMSLALIRETTLVAVGSCLYSGGLSSVDLNSGELDVHRPSLPGSDQPRSLWLDRATCGEWITASGGWYIVAQNQKAEPVSGKSRLMMLSSSGHGEARWVEMPTSIVDVVPLP